MLINVLIAFFSELFLKNYKKIEKTINILIFFNFL